MLTRKLQTTYIFIFTALAFANPAAAQSTLEQIQDRGKLLAGVRYDAPPVGYIDSEGSNLGFGPDIAREFARHLGVEVEFVQSHARNRIALLQNLQVDAIFSATTPSKTRDEVVDFSYIYNLEESVVMVRRGEQTTPEAYYNPDKIVGQLQGSYFIDLWRGFSPDAQIKEYQEFPELVLALAQGRVDVVPAPRVIALQTLDALGENAANIQLGGVFFEDPHAIILRENDSDWRDWINWGLQRMWADGSFQRIYKKHYGIDPAFEMGDAGRLQPNVERVAQEGDPW